MCLPLLLNPLLTALLQGAAEEQGILLPRGSAATQVRVRFQPHWPAGVSHVHTPANSSVMECVEQQLQV